MIKKIIIYPLYITPLYIKFVTNLIKYFVKKQYKENSTYISISEPENLKKFIIHSTIKMYSLEMINNCSSFQPPQWMLDELEREPEKPLPKYLNREIFFSNAAAFDTANETDKIAFAPSFDLFGVLSKFIIFESISS